MQSAAGCPGLRTERQLAGVAYQLARSCSELSRVERDFPRAGVSCSVADSLRGEIESGGDPLGRAFCELRSPERRRRDGAVYTPATIVTAMVDWSCANGQPARVVDPGAGSGRFLTAAAAAFPEADLVAVEVDPLAALVLRANAAVHGFADRLTLVVGDYRALELPQISGCTLFLGNPPYVRHHDIEPEWKDWLKATAAGLGYRASKLAGLHVHFLLKTCLLATEGDYGTFITSAEWLDVNYGDLVRRLVSHDLGGLSVHAIAASAMPFAGATTTGAILCFRLGNVDSICLGRIAGVSELERRPGVARRGVVFAEGKDLPRSKLATASRWSSFLFTRPAVPASFVELGELCGVHRGQVTGCNRAWIAGSLAYRLPHSLLKPTVTRARELFLAAPRMTSAETLKRVVDLPADLDAVSAEARQCIEDYLAWARANGADKSYVARHRRPWWAVSLKPPAPILCTYMARRAPAFVRNLCDARHLNVAHGIYPRESVSARLLDALALWLQHNVRVDAGRTYAGGLTKFEPKEVERILVPPPEELYERTKNLDIGGVRDGRDDVAGRVPTAPAGGATGALL